MKNVLNTILGVIGILLCITYLILTAYTVALGQTNAATDSTQTDFINTLIGTDFPHGVFAGLFVFGFIGAMIKLLLHALGGTYETQNKTPMKFSFGFMLRDNWKRLLLGFLLMFAFIRFYGFLLTVVIPLYASEFPLLGQIATLPKEVVCIVFGFFIDLTAQKLKAKYKFLQVRRKTNTI